MHVAQKSNQENHPEMNTTNYTYSGFRMTTPDFLVFVDTCQLMHLCLCLLGLFGNTSAIVILNLTKDDGTSQHVFLIALAVTDQLFLCSRQLF